MARNEKENVNEWLSVLKGAARGSHYPALYKRVGILLGSVSRTRKAVSLYKINSCTKEGDNVIVPRKVLSSGAMDHKITISALEYSSGALKSLKDTGCNIVHIKEMVGKSKINVII